MIFFRSIMRDNSGGRYQTAYASMQGRLVSNEQRVAYVKRSCERCYWGFEISPRTIENLFRLGFSADTTITFLKDIRYNCPTSFNEIEAVLPSIFERMQKNGYSPEQIVQEIKNVTCQHQDNSVLIFSFYNTAVQKGCNPDAIENLIKEAAAVGHVSKYYIITMLNKALNINLKLSVVLDVFHALASEHSGWAECMFPSVLSALKIGMEKQKLVTLFGRIKQADASRLGIFFGFLPEVIEKADSAFGKEDMANFIYDILGKYEPHFIIHILPVLPALIGANYPREQIFLYVDNIVAMKEHAVLAFGALKCLIGHVTFKNPEEISSFLLRFSHLSQKFTNKQDRTQVLKMLQADGRVEKKVLDEIFRLERKDSSVRTAFFREEQSFGFFEDYFYFKEDVTERKIDNANLEFMTKLYLMRLLRQTERNNAVALCRKIGPENLLEHLNLYFNVLLERGRAGFFVLDAIFEATRAGIIPLKLNIEEIEKINYFIKKTNTFSAVLYRIYKEKGKTVFDDIRPIAERALNDEITKEEALAIVERYKEYDRTYAGWEVLYSIFQIAIPMSASSFVSKEGAIASLKHAADHAEVLTRIPEIFRRLNERFNLVLGAYIMREDCSVNIEELTPIIRAVQSSTRTQDWQLEQAVEDYLKQGQTETLASAVRHVLYQHVTLNRLGDNTNKLQADSKKSLDLLLDIHTDPDWLPKVLEGAIKRLDPKLLLVNALSVDKVSIRKPDQLIVRINAINTDSPDRCVQVLANMLSKHTADEVRAKILSSPDLNFQIRPYIERVIENEGKASISPEALTKRLLSPAVIMLTAEIGKYFFQEESSQIQIALGIRKGIAHAGIYATSAGVCVGKNYDHVLQEGFFVIPFLEQAVVNDQFVSLQVHGYIQVLYREIKGKKAFLILGINPSSEFLPFVDAQQLYDKAINSIIAFANRGQQFFDAIYMSASASDHSNRDPIREVIRKKEYLSLDIDPILWCDNPKQEVAQVLIIWERPIQVAA